VIRGPARGRVGSGACAFALTLVLVVPVRVRAERSFFGGVGFEAPRTGWGLSTFSRGGLTLTAGGEHFGRGTAGVLVRVVHTSFPVNGDAGWQVSVPPATVSGNGTVSLTTVVVGARLKRRDLAFSPYFDVGIGVGFLQAHRPVASSPASLEPAPTRSGGVWSWGAGAAWHGRGHLGLFADGHWDTVPGWGFFGEAAGSQTAAVRAGLEVR
jgi:hypothetical protein